MLFEFDEETLVRTIQLKLTDHAPTVPSEQTEIRLGSTKPEPTDFSQLELIGTISDPHPSEWKTFTVNPPKKIKFLVI